MLWIVAFCESVASCASSKFPFPPSVSLRTLVTPIVIIWPPPPDEVTGPTADEYAEPDPEEFVAVTSTSMVWPASALCKVYDELVAPAIACATSAQYH